MRYGKILRFVEGKYVFFFKFLKLVKMVFNNELLKKKFYFYWIKINNFYEIRG